MGEMSVFLSQKVEISWKSSIAEDVEFFRPPPSDTGAKSSKFFDFFENLGAKTESRT